MKTSMKAGFALLLVLCLGFVACTQSQVITSTETAIQAVSLALPLVAAATGIPSTTVAQLLDYLQGASLALDKVSAILAAGGSTASVSVQITAALSGIVDQDAIIQSQISGLPSAIVQAIHVVAVDLEAILTQYGAPQSAAAVPGRVGAPRPAAGGKAYQFGTSDLARIESVRARAVLLESQITALKQSRRR